jgi:hypothetical protein
MSSASEVLYKVLGPKGEPCNGGNGKWHLPQRGKPGKWMKAIPDVVPCQSGYHVCTAEQLLGWLGPRIYRVEVRPGIVRVAGELCPDCSGDAPEEFVQPVICGDKIVVAEARLLSRCSRWNNKTARLFACECAERALRKAKVRKTKSDPSWEAIRVARLFAEHKATRKQLDAAWDAARDAARAAARDAAWAAARAAARDAAWAAAWDAARAAAWDAERKWQAKRLLQILEGK